MTRPKLRRAPAEPTRPKAGPGRKKVQKSKPKLVAKNKYDPERTAEIVHAFVRQRKPITKIARETFNQLTRKMGVSRQRIQQILKAQGITTQQGGRMLEWRRQTALMAVEYAKGKKPEEIGRVLAARGIHVSPQNINARLTNLNRRTRGALRQEHNAKISDSKRLSLIFLREVGILVPKGYNILPIGKIRRRYENLLQKHLAEPLVYGPLNLTRANVDRTVEALDAAGINWRSTAEHQLILANDTQKLLARHKAVEPIELDPALHYLFRFDIVKGRETMSKPKYAKLREAVRTGDRDHLFDFSRGTIIKIVARALRERGIRAEKYFSSLRQRGSLALLETMNLIGNPEADPAATLAVLNQVIFHGARNALREILDVRAGDREMETAGFEDRMQMKREGRGRRI